MSDERFLIVRLGSLGDLIFTLPVVAALRDTFLRSHITWVVDQRWLPLLEGNPDLNAVIALPGRSFGEFFACGRKLRAGAPTCVLDIQGLYKSALLAKLSHAPQRIGYSFSYAREALATLFYTKRVAPRSAHMVDQNLELAAAAGAEIGAPRFPLYIPGDAHSTVEQLLRSSNITQYVVLSPGGGWRSKCWPPERYGELAIALWNSRQLRIIINCGPGELKIGEVATARAGLAMPIMVQYKLPELMALLQRAELVVAADSGPLHLASALGTPVVGLYGPTSPARNGPYGKRGIVVRNASEEDTTYKRGNSYSEEMLSISVQQVLAAAERALEIGAKDRLESRMVPRNAQSYVKPLGPVA